MNTKTGSRPIVVEAPNEVLLEGDSVFLAGGITRCFDWQQEMICLLKDFNGVILNPRRANYPDVPGELRRQVDWERRYLRASTLRLFWFASETDCPVTLFELGSVFGANEAVVVGIDPEYSRRADVEVQTSLVHSELTIAWSLEALAKQVGEFFHNKQKVTR